MKIKNISQTIIQIMKNHLKLQKNNTNRQYNNNLNHENYKNLK